MIHTQVNGSRALGSLGLMLSGALYLRFRLWVRAYRALMKAHRRTYGELELPLLTHIVPKRVSLDVGANKGLFTFFLRKYSTQVVAFEPNRELFDKLSSTRYPNVVYTCAAVSSASGQSIFYVPKRGRDGRRMGNIGSLKRNPKFESDEVAVPTVTIDEAAKDLDVGFIKMDTEGTELDVIRGAAGVIARCRPVLFVEILDKSGASAKEIANLLKQWRYSMAEYSNRRLVLRENLETVKNRNVIFLPIS